MSWRCGVLILFKFMNVNYIKSQSSFDSKFLKIFTILNKSRKNPKTGRKTEKTIPSAT